MPPRSLRRSGLVGVVGEDAPRSLFHVFDGRDVDTAGLEVRKGSKTFRWHGSYVKDLNEAVTVEVDLNVLAERAPGSPTRSWTASMSSWLTRIPSCSRKCWGG